MTHFTHPTLAVLFAIFSLQLGASLANQLFPIVGPAGATTLRIFFATLILLVLFRPWRAKFDWSSLKTLLIYGVSLGIMNLSFYEALKTVPQGIVVAIEFLGPLTLALLQSRRALDFLWAALAIAGLYLLLPIHQSSDLDPRGLGFAMIAGVLWGLYIFIAQRAGRSAHGTNAIVWAMVIATLVTLPFGWRAFLEVAPIPKLWGIVVGVAVLSSVVPYTLEIIALKTMPTKVFGILMSLEPAVAALVAFFYLNQLLGLGQWLAIALISSASFGSSYFAKRAAKN